MPSAIWAIWSWAQIPLMPKQTIKEGIALLPAGAVPIFLGGEHSIAPPIVEGLARRSAPGDLGVLVLDAHLDLREEYGCTRYSHACASRRILEKGAGRLCLHRHSQRKP